MWQFDVYSFPQILTQLKTQTMELLDPDWKENRNKHLLMKMLNLDEPIITAKVSAVYLIGTISFNSQV